MLLVSYDSMIRSDQYIGDPSIILKHAGLKLSRRLLQYLLESLKSNLYTLMSRVNIL